MRYDGLLVGFEDEVDDDEVWEDENQHWVYAWTCFPMFMSGDCRGGSSGHAKTGNLHMRQYTANAIPDLKESRHVRMSTNSSCARTRGVSLLTNLEKCFGMEKRLRGFSSSRCGTEVEGDGVRDGTDEIDGSCRCDAASVRSVLDGRFLSVEGSGEEEEVVEDRSDCSDTTVSAVSGGCPNSKPDLKLSLI